MRIIKFVLPVGALAMGALMLAPTESHGFTTIGGSLSLSQRDFRVYNNFTDATANNNTTPDPNWPGYTGAEMAIWKACSEWASELHGLTGAGDPVQTVGSGGANFDPCWQGDATGVGTTDQNIHSELAGSSGGVLAFCETPISDGWRIRYYSTWTWQDGPGGPSSGIDLQGVACHEYGHALGLGHSNASGATMQPNISGTGVGQRSINNDDIAGVQFIYGVRDDSQKPHVNGFNLESGVLTITGKNFNPTLNEVWFTQAGAGGTGTPVKMTGLNSNGFLISTTLPANVGPGDILVKRGSLAGNKGLSNAFPFDPAQPPNVLAENLNVDLGTTMGTPGNGQGGAAGNVGTWTGVDVPTGATMLFDIGGQLSTGILSHTGSAGETVFNHPATSGFWEKIFDDRHGIGCTAGVSTATYTVTGLKAGVYDVYVYAWSPEDPVNSFTDITVNGGVLGTQSCGGIGYTGGTLVPGGHYVRDSATVASNGGSISFTATTSAQCGGVNAFQILPGALCGVPVSYCTAGTSASGCNATLSSSGTPSASATSGFSLIASGVEGLKDGLFFYGVNGQQANFWGNGTSYQCVVPPVIRAGLLPSTGTNGACDGQFVQDMAALWASNPNKNPGAGADVNAQLWYRDPLNTSNQTTSLSDALSFRVCP